PTSIPSTNSSLGTSGAAGSGRVTSTHCPAVSRSDLDTVVPLTKTAPSAHSSAATVRDKPNILAKAASMRRPSLPSGTGRVRTSLFIFRPPFLSQHGKNKYNDTYRNAGISNIEYGKISHRNIIHDMPNQKPGSRASRSVKLPSAPPASIASPTASHRSFIFGAAMATPMTKDNWMVVNSQVEPSPPMEKAAP